MQSAAERRKEQDEVAKKKKEEEAEKEKAKSGGRGAGAGFAGQRAKETEKLGEFEKHTKARGVVENKSSTDVEWTNGARACV